MKSRDEILRAVNSALSLARDIAGDVDDIYEACEACDCLGDGLSEDYADDAVCAVSSLVGALYELSRTIQV